MTGLWLEDGAVFREWNGIEKLGGTSYQPNIGDPDMWPDDELAAINLYKPLVPAVPFGKVVAGSSVQRVDGVVTFVYTLSDAPGSIDAQFHPLEPWQFWSIIELSGLGEQALRDAIDLIPDATFKVKALQKLAHPPGGTYRRSDPLFNNPFLMMQLGMTEEEINGLWVEAFALE